MDADELERRLERVHSALDSRFERDVAAASKQRVIYTIDENRRLVPLRREIQWGGADSPAQAENRLRNAIHGIAALKDNIKAALVRQGLAGQLYEDVINREASLQLITDLDNIDKHGYPLKKTPRSGCHPKLVDFASEAILSTGSDPGGSAMLQWDPRTGEVRSSGDVRTSISARVVDENGAEIAADISTLIDDAINLINGFIASHGLTAP